MKRTVKLITLMLALVMIIGAVAGLNVFAEGEAVEETPAAPTITLAEANLVYDEEIKIAFTVDGFAEGETAGVAVYANENDTEYAFVTTDMKVDAISGKEYFVTYGFAAKDFDQTIYVAAVKVDGGEVVEVGEKVAYSVTTYAQGRLDAAEAGEIDLTDAQTNLYNKILAYNAAANAVFGN